jgi:glycosyltransferase involved in cell wall biosynthesis
LSDRILLSSESSRKDLAAVAPGSLEKTRVLRFVVDVPESPVEGRNPVLDRLGIRGPYFHLPNQFWVHKNHGVVLEALAIARGRGHEIPVVATGSTGDHRQPGYFPSLTTKARALGVEELFVIAGTVPYSELLTLMRRSIALINPSLFEGWSTTVEEAKSLGKTILLSDIPVHREQDPRRALFFDPHSPEQLAEALIQTAASWDPVVDENEQRRAREELPLRRGRFAEAYERIITEVGNRGS